MTKAKYLGVYENRHKLTQDALPYRVAIKRYINGEPEYRDIGKFRSAETSAFIFNIYALNTFGKSTVINDVDLTDSMEVEIKEYAQRAPEFSSLVDHAIEIVEQNREALRLHVPDPY